MSNVQSISVGGSDKTWSVGCYTPKNLNWTKEANIKAQIYPDLPALLTQGLKYSIDVCTKDHSCYYMTICDEKNANNADIIVGQC